MSTVSNSDQSVRSYARKGSRNWLPVVVVAIIFFGGFVATYNELVSSDQQVQSQWAQVQNVYQRRLDLVPNLVETVKGAANFEKSSYLAVTEARAKAVGVLDAAGSNPANDPAKIEQIQRTQGDLSSALNRLMVVVEGYPDLKATGNFRDLQAQLEGTENRIAVERMRFNESGQAFNTKRLSFPTSLVASLFGSRFAVKSYFKADEAAQTAPKVKF